MILQALTEYYNRNPGSAPHGWEKKEIQFIICIDSNGLVIDVEDTRENIHKGLQAHPFLVPRSVPRSGKTSYKTTFFLWDHIGYVLGYPKNDPKTPFQHTTWKNFIERLHILFPNNLMIEAIKKFYTDTDRLEKILLSDMFKPCITAKTTPNIMFRVNGKLVVESPDIVDYVNRQLDATLDLNSNNVIGTCLISGEHGVIARTHHDTRIGKDAKKLVGFQKDSGYDSYGKSQAYNAPICVNSEFAYTTALNTLLHKDSAQKIQVGDATTVFWASKATPFENQFHDFFGEPLNDNPDALTTAVKALFKSVENGAFAVDADTTRFYVLGLSPNVARISVRFWYHASIDELAMNILQYFDDMRIVHDPDFTDDLAIKWLLRSLVRKPNDLREWDQKIPPNIAGETMRCILEGLPFPETLLQTALLRVKAERDVTYPRAKIIKGCLNRKLRKSNPNNERSLTMALDTDNTNIGYRLGRLFATLEQCQKKAQPGGKDMKTIRDRFYSSASSSPVSVFAYLMRLNKHHLAKLSDGSGRYYSSLIGDIIYHNDKQAGICAFPAHLPLNDQGQFAIGYYHQMQNFKFKRTDKETV